MRYSRSAGWCVSHVPLAQMTDPNACILNFMRHFEQRVHVPFFLKYRSSTDPFRMADLAFNTPEKITQRRHAPVSDPGYTCPSFQGGSMISIGVSNVGEPKEITQRRHAPVADVGYTCPSFQGGSSRVISIGVSNVGENPRRSVSATMVMSDIESECKRRGLSVVDRRKWSEVVLTVNGSSWNLHAIDPQGFSVSCPGRSADQIVSALQGLRTMQLRAFGLSF